MFPFANGIVAVFFLLIFSASSGIHAQESKPPSQSSEKDQNTAETTTKQALPKEVIQQTKEPYDIRAEKVTTIEIKKIAFHSYSLTDILKATNSIRTYESGGLGQFSTALVRGSNSRQVKIYRDGIPLASTQNGFLDFSKIHIQQYERIEIYKGYYPATLASNSSGAVINLISNTQNTEDKDTFQTNMTFGSFETFILNSGIEHKKKDHYFLLNLNHAQAKNNFKFRNNRGTPYNPNDDFTDTKKNNGYIDSSLEHLFQKKTSLGSWAFHWYGNNGEQEIGGPKNVRIKEAKFINKNINADVSIQVQASPAFSYTSTLHSTTALQKLHDPLGEIGFTQNQLYATNFQIGFKNDFSYQLNDWFFCNLMADPIIEIFEKTNIATNENRRWQRENIIVSIEPVIATTSKKWELRANTILENISDNSHRDDNTLHQSDFHITTKLTSRYLADNDFIYRFSAGQNLRTPSLFERYGDSGLVTGNPHLKNETYYFGEFSIEKKWDLTKLNSTLDSQITVYSKKGNQIITYQQLSAGIARPFNIEKSQITGLESQFNFVHHWFNLLLQYDITQAFNRSQNFKNNKYLPSIPAYRFFAEFDLKIKRWQFFYRAIFSGKEYFDEANIVVNKPFLKQDVGCKLIFKTHEIAFEVRNLGNIQREDFINYPLPGISFLLQCNFTF